MAQEVYRFAQSNTPDAMKTAVGGGFEPPSVLWFAPGSMATELVEQAWALRGELADLRGISGPWAAVLWQPQRQLFYVVTDPIGIQPVFWLKSADGQVWVASWLDQLLEQSQQNPEIDYEAVLMESGHGLRVPQFAHRTQFVGVNRVPWGRAVEFDVLGGVRTVQYWDREALPEIDQTLSLDDSAELFREHIDGAIRTAIGETAVYGAHVSGGLDCTSVAVRANQLLRESGQSLRVGYSWAPPENVHSVVAGDERPLLDIVSEQEGFTIKRSFDDGRGDWYWGRDIHRYPQSTHMVERLVLPTAKDDGVEVMLSGWGGDELSSFNGRRVLHSLIRNQQKKQAVRQAALRVKTGEVGRFKTSVRTAGILLAAVDTDVFDLARNPRQYLSSLRAARDIEAELRRHWPVVAQARKEAVRQLEEIEDYRDFQWYLLSNGHLQHRTTWWYQTGRLFDLRYRFPLLHLDLVKAAFSVPWQAYYYNGWTRVAFRRAVQEWLPPQVAWHPIKDEPARMSSTHALINRPSQPPQQLRADPKMLEVLRLSSRTAVFTERVR